MEHKDLKSTLDAFILEQRGVNKSQNLALEAITVKQSEDGRNLEVLKNSVQDVVAFYNGSSQFFKFTMKASLWIGAVAVAVGAMWGLVKFIIITAISK